MRAVLLLLALVLGGPAQSMTLTPVSDNEYCDVRLSGNIETGDFGPLTDALASAKAASRTNYLAVCLHSAGGSFLEASRIAGFIENNRIGTVIDDGDTCLSACSIIFMLGSRDDPSASLTSDIGDNRVLMEFDRRMHINGTLGFHRPSATLDPNRVYSAAEMENAFRVAINSALEFMRIANRWKPKEGQPALKSDLIENLLQHEGMTDFFYIDTVDKAGRFDIKVVGFEPPARFSAREALNACDNASNWMSSMAQFPVENADVKALARLTSRRSEGWPTDGDHYEMIPLYYVRGRDIFYHRSGGGGGERVCQVLFRTYGEKPNTSVSVTACGGDSVLGQPLGGFCHLDEPADYMETLPEFSFFPSGTPLTALETTAREIEQRAVDIEKALMPPPTYSCIKEDDAVVSVVTDGAHLPIRADARGDSELIAVARPFTSFERGPNPGVVLGEGQDHDDCVAACRAQMTDPSLNGENSDWVKQTIDACFDANLLRWSVTLPGGDTGWASAKYLR